MSVAGLLPCFWIYREVGRSIAVRSSEDNRYRAWIDTYSGEAFEASVDRMIGLTDALAEAANETTRRRMALAFAKATTLEWMFWDSAYRDERWPLLLIPCGAGVAQRLLLNKLARQPADRCRLVPRAPD